MRYAVPHHFPLFVREFGSAAEDSLQLLRPHRPGIHHVHRDRHSEDPQRCGRLKDRRSCPAVRVHLQPSAAYADRLHLDGHNFLQHLRHPVLPSPAPRLRNRRLSSLADGLAELRHLRLDLPRVAFVHDSSRIRAAGDFSGSVCAETFAVREGVAAVDAHPDRCHHALLPLQHLQTHPHRLPHHPAVRQLHLSFHLPEAERPEVHNLGAVGRGAHRESARRQKE